MVARDYQQSTEHLTCEHFSSSLRSCLLACCCVFRIFKTNMRKSFVRAWLSFLSFNAQHA